MKHTVVNISKFLSLVLRHQPESIELTLDNEGWADIATLITLANQRGWYLHTELIQKVVRENDKQRFVISEDGLQIRAQQGHSIAVDLDIPVTTPPEVLYHGTASRFMKSISSRGLKAGHRQHVHLSPDLKTAWQVGARYGKPVVLLIHAAEMHAAGHTFYRAHNGVWLTDAVPVDFIEIKLE